MTVRPGLDLRTNRRLSVARRDWRLRGPLCLERSAKSCRSTSIVHSPHECTVNRVIFYAEAIVGGQRATCFAFVQMKNMNSSVLQFLVIVKLVFLLTEELGSVLVSDDGIAAIFTLYITLCCLTGEPIIPWPA